MESLVLNELLRQATTIDEALTFAHFRDRSGIEMDIVVERPDGRVMAIGVKSARSVNQRDASGLSFLRSVSASDSSAASCSTQDHLP